MQNHAATQWEYTDLDDEFAALIQDNPCTPEADCLAVSGHAAAPADTGQGEEDSLLQLFAQQLQHFAQDIAASLDKQVTVHVQGFNQPQLSDNEITTVQDIVIQLVRNSLAHAIETPAERQAAHKPAVGNIRIRLDANAEQLQLSFADDGQGLDVAAIKTQAVQQGWMSAEQAAGLSDKDLIRMVFSSGFSTAEQVHDHAGHGIGLDIVRTHLCKTNPPGKLDVYNKPGQGLKFVISLPRR